MIIKARPKAGTIINTVILLVLFMFYALTFMVTKFYGLTEDYVGVFVFLMLSLLFLNNVDFVYELKHKAYDLYLLAAVVLITGINIIVVSSGYGAFFIPVNFIMIFYLADKIQISKKQFYMMGICYLVLLLYWFIFAYNRMFAEYGSYAMNTNTASTFTMFSFLCLFMFLEMLYDKYKIVGLFMVIVLVKALQITMYHRGRGSFVMLVIFVLLRYIVPKKVIKNRKVFLAILLLATFGSLAFVAFYVFLGTTGVNFSLPFFYKNLFSGREAIWLEFWNLFKEKPFTGIGTGVTIESFFEFNVHNAMYNILVIHGVVVFAGTIVMIFMRLFSLRKRLDVMNSNSLRISVAAIAAIVAVFIESYFDVDLIWANYSLNLLFLLLTAFGYNKAFSEGVESHEHRISDCTSEMQNQ